MGSKQKTVQPKKTKWMPFRVPRDYITDSEAPKDVNRPVVKGWEKKLT